MNIAAELIVSAAAGAIAAPLVARMGFAQLGEDGSRVARLVAAFVGLCGGAAAGLAAHRAGGYLPLAAFIVWSVGLSACTACDWATHRIPTPLVRRATIAVGLLLILVWAAEGDWRAPLLAGVASVVAFVLCMIGWRFAGLGRGDARLAALGGLGLGWSNQRSIALGLIVLCVVSLVQVGVALMRGGDRRTMIAYGLPLSVGFLVAATAI